LRHNGELARILQYRLQARNSGKMEEYIMSTNDARLRSTAASIFAFAASGALLVTICFAPAFAQQKEHTVHDGTNSKWPVAVSYLA
jgi:hypothetical protein